MYIIVKNNKKHLYLNPNRTLFNHLSYDIINLNKTQNFYNRKFEVKLSIDPSIIISSLNKYNLSIFNNIKLYLPSNQHRYLLELIYFLSTNNQENFNNILNTMISKFSKDKLEKNVESINMNLNDCYILIFFELFRKYKELYNDPYINNIFDMYYNIFNFKLKKSNINSRINIIFILFHSLMNNNNNIKTNYYKTNYNPDIDNINQIYNKLIEFYELPKEIKKNIKKPSRKKSKDNDSSKDTTSNSSNNNDSNDNDIDNVDYLYTLINFNNKAYKKKLNKINNNKKNLKNIINKPININGNECVWFNTRKERKFLGIRCEGFIEHFTFLKGLLKIPKMFAKAPEFFQKFIQLCVMFIRLLVVLNPVGIIISIINLGFIGFLTIAIKLIIFFIILFLCKINDVFINSKSLITNK